MGPGKRREPLRRHHDCEASVSQIKEWRNRPHRNERGRRYDVAALLCGGHSFFASTLSGYISGKQRNDSDRARCCIHDISKWRLAAKCSPHFGADRRKRWNAGLEWEAGEYPEISHQARDRLRGAFLSRRSASIWNRQSCLYRIWSQKNAGSR